MIWIMHHCPPEVKEVKVYVEENAENKDILNNFGKEELLRVTRRLDDMGVLELADKGVILRYSIAAQMQNKYLQELDQIEGVALYLKMYEVFY